MATTDAYPGWDLRESGPTHADRTVLLLPGGFCTGAFFEDLMAEPSLVDGRTRLVAATLPGFGRTAPPTDPSMECFASLAGTLASDLDADVVVGHSLGANVALEMAAVGRFAGPVVLLSATFSRGDEEKALRLFDRLGRVPGVGGLAWAALVKALAAAMKGRFPAARSDALGAALSDNDPQFCRRMVRQYFEYLDRYGSLVPRLCGAGVDAWVVRGDRDEIGLTDGERRGLEACPTVRIVTVPDAAHFVMIDQPARTANLIREVLEGSQAGSGRGSAQPG